ncbi:hypothetical protein TNCV_1907081 [Trichonephila clavipes]|nr:hypothetical protein TNCV_1907081 [Trichonephila clavipes]
MNLEGTELTNIVTNVIKMVTKVGKLVANLVTKYDSNLALSPGFRQVPIETINLNVFCEVDHSASKTVTELARVHLQKSLLFLQQHSKH